MAITLQNPVVYSTDHQNELKELLEKRSKIFQSSWQAQINDLKLYTFPTTRLLRFFYYKTLPNIILLGKGGAGKGTFSHMLRDKYGYVHISVGDLQRREYINGTALGYRIKRLYELKKASSSEMVNINFSLASPYLESSIAKKKPFILDNFPTNEEEIEKVLTFIKEHKLQENIILLVLNISDEEINKRLPARRICITFSCSKNYNLLFCPPRKENICDDCGSRLYRRLSDQPQSINRRLIHHRNKVIPNIRLLAESMDLFAVNNIFELFQKHLGIH